MSQTTITRRGGALAALILILLGAAGARGQVPRTLALADVLDGTEEQELRWPTSVAAASENEVAVADAYRPRLLVFRRIGASWQLAWVTELPGTPVGLAHDGRRYVASLRQGEDLVEVRQGGVEPLDLPAGVVPGPLAAAAGGGLLVVDAGRSRVLRLDRDGAVRGETPVDGLVTGLTAEAGGGFVVALGDRAQVLRFDAAGTLDRTQALPPEGPVAAWPAGLATDSAGRLFVVDRHNGRILVLDTEGRWIGVGSRQGWEPGLLLHPAGITRLVDGSLLVADQGNGRAQLFRLIEDGGP